MLWGDSFVAPDGFLEVDTWTDVEGNRAALRIDGEFLEAERTWAWGSVSFDVGNKTNVHVRWRGLGKVWSVQYKDFNERTTTVMSFKPPPGTRAERRYEFEQRYPALMSLRHVVVNVGGTLFALLGLGALIAAFVAAVKALIPDINIPWPSIDWPDWLRWLNPMTYLRPFFAWLARLIPDLPDLPDLSPYFAWLDPIVTYLDEHELVRKILFGVLVGLVIARREYAQRKKLKAHQTEQEHSIETQKDEPSA